MDKLERLKENLKKRERKIAKSKYCKKIVQNYDAILEQESKYYIPILEYYRMIDDLTIEELSEVSDEKE